MLVGNILAVSWTEVFQKTAVLYAAVGAALSLCLQKAVPRHLGQPLTRADRVRVRW
jgi:hypothetical protein